MQLNFLLQALYTFVYSLMLLPDTRLLSCFTSQRLLKTLVVFTILCSVTSTQSNNHVNKVQRLGTVNISAKFHGR